MHCCSSRLIWPLPTGVSSPISAPILASMRITIGLLPISSILPWSAGVSQRHKRAVRQPEIFLELSIGFPRAAQLGSRRLLIKLSGVAHHRRSAVHVLSEDKPHLIVGDTLGVRRLEESLHLRVSLELVQFSPPQPQQSVHIRLRFSVPHWCRAAFPGACRTRPACARIIDVRNDVRNGIGRNKKTASRRSTTLLLIALIIRYFRSLVPGAGLEPAQP